MVLSRRGTTQGDRDSPFVPVEPHRSGYHPQPQQHKGQTSSPVQSVPRKIWSQSGFIMEFGAAGDSERSVSGPGSSHRREQWPDPSNFSGQGRAAGGDRQDRRTLWERSSPGMGGLGGKNRTAEVEKKIRANSLGSCKTTSVVLLLFLSPGDN